MAGIFTKRIWQPCICQPNKLKWEIKKTTDGAKRGAKQKSGGAMAHPGPPLESPLDSNAVFAVSSSKDGKKQNQSVHTHCISESFRSGIRKKG